MGEGRWRLHTVERTVLTDTGFGCSVWSVIKEVKAKGFRFGKPGRTRVSWDLNAPEAGLALAVK